MGTKSCRITVMRIVEHSDLREKFENPIEHACDLSLGQEFVSVGGKMPEGMCESAWSVMQPFVQSIIDGKEIYEGWMKNPKSAMISCNDGFRPVSFYIELIE